MTMNANQSAVHNAICSAVDRHKNEAASYDELVDKVYADLEADTELDLSEMKRARCSRRIQLYIRCCEIADAEDRRDDAEVARLESLPTIDC